MTDAWTPLPVTPAGMSGPSGGIALRLASVAGVTGNGISDDTAGWLRAISALGAQTPGGTLYLDPGYEFTFSEDIAVPSNVRIWGGGSGQVAAKATGAGRLMFGPNIGSAPQQQGSEHGGFQIQGNGGPTHPLHVNCVDAVFADILAQGGSDAAVMVAGQNCTFINLAADGVVLDNGCGGNNFIKPELHGPNPGNGHNLIIRESVAPPAGSYPYPENNYFSGGIIEFSNIEPVLLQAGAFNYFDFMNFFTNANVALCLIQNDASGSVNGRWYFRDCAWTGNGLQAAGGPQVAVRVASFSGDVGFILEDTTTLSGLSAGFVLDVNVSVFNQGRFALFNIGESQIFRASSAGIPIWFAYDRDAQQTLTLTNGWTGHCNFYRDAGRVWIDAQLTDGGAATSDVVGFFPVGWKTGIQTALVPISVADGTGGITGAVASVGSIASDGTLRIPHGRYTAANEIINLNISLPLNNYPS